MKGKKKALAANQGGSRATRVASLTNGQVYYTTDDSPGQLSSLLDLAQFTVEKQLLRAERFQALADAHRRRAWKAMDALKEYQRLLQETGQ